MGAPPGPDRSEAIYWASRLAIIRPFHPPFTSWLRGSRLRASVGSMIWWEGARCGMRRTCGYPARWGSLPIGARARTPLPESPPLERRRSSGAAGARPRDGKPRL